MTDAILVVDDEEDEVGLAVAVVTQLSFVNDSNETLDNQKLFAMYLIYIYSSFNLLLNIDLYVDLK